MKFARYWEQASNASQDMFAWGWSDVSVDEAKAMAQERLQRLVAKYEAGELWGETVNEYYSVERPPREEIVKEVLGREDKEPTAIVSRNSYGCLVLNTKDFALIDIDVPKPSLGFLGGLKRLFGGEDPYPQAVAEAQEKIGQWMLLAKRRGRLYRTSGGFRLALTDQPEVAASDATQQMLEDLGSDPLFTQLCRNQESFRARLTPKYWRCDFGPPPSRFPWPTPEAEVSQRQWERDYERATVDYAVCELVEEYGRGPVAESLAPLLRLHDEYVLNPGKPLA